jgi:hypothetical protein
MRLQYTTLAGRRSCVSQMSDATSCECVGVKDAHGHGPATHPNHCGCSSAGALDLLAGFAPLEPKEPKDGFLAEMTNIPTTMATSIKVSAATTILLKCRRAGRSPALGFESIIPTAMLPLA